MILVTGASGHIGNVLVRELVKKGEKVRVFVHTSDKIGIWMLKDLDIEVVSGDIRDVASVHAACEGIHTVYHCAAIVTILPNNTEELFSTNVDGVKNIVEACLKYKVRKLIHVSSIHAFEDVPDDGRIVDEQVPIYPDKAIGMYGRSKALGTLVVMDAVKEKKLPAVVVHPTACIGPFDYRESLSGRSLRLLRSGMPFGMGGYNWVDVRDVAHGLVLAQEKGRIGERYLLSGNTLRVTEMKRVIDKLCHRPYLSLPMSRFMVEMSKPFYAMSYYITKKSPLVTSDTCQIVFSNYNIVHDKATKELGYRSRPFEETVQDFYTWYDANKKEVYQHMKAPR